MEQHTMTTFRPSTVIAPPFAEPHILVLDDDAKLRALIGDYLEKQGMQVTLAGTGAELRAVLASERVDAIVLDLMMPGEDGLSILRELTERGNGPPVLMLSAMAADIDRIVGLELGADDYLGKPVNPRELLARLRAVLRRRPQTQNDATLPLHFNGWMVDARFYTVRDAAGRDVDLTSGEFRLLYALASRPGRVVSREELLADLYGDEAEAFDRAIDVAVSRLRAKLSRYDGEGLIRTIRGEGYLFTART